MSTRVVFTSFMRPAYLYESLESWSKVRGWDKIEKDLFLDPSPAQNEMRAVAEQFGVTVHLNEERKGVLTNPWNALEWAFNQPGTDFAILGEEDLVVSSDILEYFAWARRVFSYDEALGVCCYSGSNEADPDEASLGEAFGVWIWGTWKQSWYAHIRDTWDHNYSTNNGVPGMDAGWDHNLNRLARTVKPFVHSHASRSKHIGEHNGTHMTPQIYASIFTPTFEVDRPPTSYVRV